MSKFHIKSLITPQLRRRPLSHEFASSLPCRTLDYTVSAAGTVQIPGDGRSRTDHLLEIGRSNPTVLTRQSAIRKEQTKELRGHLFQLRPVNNVQLDAAYAAYVAGNLTFNQIWESVYCWLHRVAKNERSDFGMRRRGLEQDQASEFMDDFRSNLGSKAFKGKKGSSFHNYVNQCWRNWKVDALKERKEDDAIHVSATEAPDREDANNDVVQGVSILDKVALERYLANPADPYQKTLDDAVCSLQSRRLTLIGEPLTCVETKVLDAMVAGNLQKQTAAALGLSHDVVQRLHTKLKQKIEAEVQSLRDIDQGVNCE